MAHLRIDKLRKSYGALEVLRGFDLDVPSGEFVVFVGPSGCGKSTLLRAIAGLDGITSGSISIDGDDITDLPPSDRGIAMVFQSYALYPHMTVHDNLAFGLKMAGMSRAEQKVRIDASARMLQIDALLDRFPRELSGGQRQRVAIGRAITRDPSVFLFDEPLSNLDAALRVATRIEIARLKEKLPDTTMIYVTHDQVEAMTLADRIVVLQGGRIEQVGKPLELYHRPNNLFVAGFIGSPAMNFIQVTITAEAGRTVLANPVGRDIPVPEVPGGASGEPATLGFRPEDLRIGAAGEGLVEGTVGVVEMLGDQTILYLDAGTDAPIVVKLPGEYPHDIGQPVAVTCDPARMHLFDADGKTLANGLSGLKGT
ncbi:ABC transporter ATP-binding protein [Roseisalinus antarcticus]|uniref:Maltose/maltodextrin import ATP-binding protein MalK n=1 Tax=Roseisalinus antarcticus TaxID=254357 RepID=A0A1Y5U0P6_9RHOB|nr:sn-glycerol-3-phosphate ABC transporter ATP-binding protein UgpC [Roseisalinus antarcticus]SLN77499.1 Maltose/maltodextrin import ATP-binding protein MalK [Roseisalinus antarcticus]